MNGKFIIANEIIRDQLDWGEMGWISRPATTAARNICEIAVTLEPGFGHNFHKHPQQEEVIHVLAGEIEQWLGTEKRTLKPGDAVFIGPDLVHASFNTGKQTAKLLVVLSPCVGDGGYELDDVANEAPWNSLRK
ncbi:MAG: cupin domain-containing protein [Verrucomicrobia bacterium]|nr:cupin domain-containing protein [Verrucomicrobiota bacterium]